MNGEIFCLSNEENKNFLRKPLEVKTVYPYNDVGDKIIYKNKKDYIINYQLGFIKRTQNSRIPNYANHKVNYLDNNKFEFVSEPRNPELNVKYQIHVDYTYIPDANEIREIPNDSKYLSQKNINKILNDKHINIALIGDSISCGAQTTPQYYFNDQISNTFLGYLKETLKEKYDCQVNTNLISKNGMSREYLINNLDYIISESPDIAIIEFGMNDHLSIDANGVKSFTSDIEKCIKKLKKNDIDVIIVGFFQQNQEGIEEDISNTILYNQELKELVKNENCYIADVFDIFQKVALKKNLKEDLVVDYMHHPSDWGHQLYLISLLSVFNVDGSIKPIEIEKFVYVR